MTSLHSTQVDYPAAHSMDSAWFAVDADGHVGFFPTGEGGAMPETNVEYGEVIEALIPALKSVRSPQEPIVDWAANPLIDPNQHVEFRVWKIPRSTKPTFWERVGLVKPKPPDPDGRVEEIVSLVASEEYARAIAKAGKAVLIPTTSGCALYYPEIGKLLFDELHARGECRGCRWSYRSCGEEQYPLGCLGVYAFAATSGWATPYVRDLIPQQPIKIEELPQVLRSKLSAIVLNNVRFGDSAPVQPLEHVACFAWTAQWLATDWKHVYQVPGMEIAYAGDYDDFVAGFPKYICEPPSEPNS